MEKKHNILQSFRQDLSSVSGSRSVATIEKAARGETPHVASPMPAFWALPFFSIIDRLHLPRAPYLSSLSYPARPVPLFRSSQSKYKWFLIHPEDWCEFICTHTRPTFLFSTEVRCADETEIRLNHSLLSFEPTVAVPRSRPWESSSIRGWIVFPFV